MRFSIIVTALFCAAAASSASAGGASFSADAVRSQAGKGSQAGKLYVSDAGARFEYEVQGRKVVQLIQTGSPLMRMLIPDQKKYVEAPAPPGGATMVSGPKTPCQPAPNLACTRSGSKDIGGIATERWAMQPKGVPKAMVIFWDPTRRLAIRRILPDGKVAEMRKGAQGVHEGRSVETFALVVKANGGEEQKATMLYDPELAIVVAETHANGYKREVKNIKVGPVDAALFQVPAGFQKTVLPRGSSATPSGGQRP